MRYFILKSLLFLIGLASMFTVFSHNKNPNTFFVAIQDSSIAIHTKALSKSTKSNFKIEPNDNWMLLKRNKSIFQSIQIEEWKYSRTGQSSFEVTSRNKNPTSVQIIQNGKNTNWLETEDRFTIDPRKELNSTSVVRNYIFLGVEHILIGFDHLLFVIGLLFIVRRKSILWTITAFTVAHSITLGLAVSGWLAPIKLGLSAIWVEAMIAGSILILAIEMRKGVKHSTQKAVGIAFTFGLLHGLGFASVLQELGLPNTAFWQALVSFNIGVEIGQLLFISLLILLFQVIKRAISFEKLTISMSILVGGLAAFWCIERTLILANLI